MKSLRKKTMLSFKQLQLTEDEYILSEMPRNASLFTTGNGYMGVRGSLEEFGETKIQGLFVRGLIDEIIEIVEPFPDNVYMKKYYFDEEKLKKFDRQDSCINFPDFLLLRFTIGDSVFYPWDGEILLWNRQLNPYSGELRREVIWRDNRGNETWFLFERFASYADEHTYFQRATVRPLNHSLPVRVLSGLDANVRTNGQIISEKLEAQAAENGVRYHFLLGKKYGYRATICTGSKFFAGGTEVLGRGYESDGLYAQVVDFPPAAEYVVEKQCFVFTTRDGDMEGEVSRFRLGEFSYEQEREAHTVAYRKLFSEIDVKIKGDEQLDAALRFANYHTLISASVHDSVHSLSAKSLSGEKYNQFVWWDCEIYQMPVFTHALPELAKHALEYRYRMLPAARELARKQGFSKGARYPFVSSVDGDEHVWIYARHPFLQIHIMADIAYAICDYYDNTGDREFMLAKGLEMLAEIARYWLQRAEKTGRGYEIRNVTGTDEHHDYVNNDAYTNYLAAYTLKRTAELIACFGESAKEVLKKFSFTEAERKEAETLASQLYLPKDENGMIPQFDGYFSLSRTLEVEGNGTGKNFQMKQAGLYHKSQIIKQPDVMLLYSYVNVGQLPEFEANWDYYEGMCEASSSLTFPVHAVCSARAGRMNSFLKYFEDTLFMDIKDIHNCAYQGIHAGCAAGGWYSVFRGVMGITVRDCIIETDPVHMPFWEEVSLSFHVGDTKVKAVQTQDAIVFEKVSGKDIKVKFNGTMYELKKELTFVFRH